MAANQALYGGYECNWIEDPPDDLKCQICLMVAREPRQHGDNKGCGKIFCKTCITLHQRNSKKCPNCREKLILFQDKRSVQHINALRVKCENLENGCRWVGEFADLRTRLNTCDYALLPCDNKCTNNGQAVKVLRKNLPDHLMNHCPRRLYKCPHCEEIGEHHERTSTHLEICPQVSIPCPTSISCTAAIPRCERHIHRATCQYERVPCKYAEVGCRVNPQRKDLKEHEENDQIHLKVTTAKVLELTQQLTDQKEMLDEIWLTTMESKPQITFRMGCFRAHKNDKTVIFSSPHFYTSHRGYQFRIRVYPGGNGRGEGTHISIFACLMKGDYDDAITWPFLGEATFELLNQIEDKNHHKATTKFLNNASSQRVEGEDERALGKTKFIAYRDLEYNPANNCQYLKYDALIFRVSVRPPSYKWLQCTHA